VGDRALYNPNDGLTGRDGGPYLDIEEAKRAEIRRAEVEGREPDFENLPPSAGIQLVTATALLNTVGVNQPSKTGSSVDSDETVVKGFADDKNNPMRVVETVKAEDYAQVEHEDDLENNEFPLREQLAVSDKGEQRPGDTTDVDSGEKINVNDKADDSVVLDENADDDDIINALTVDDGTDSTTDSATKGKSTAKSTAKSGK
jgi:hypothetical protein